MLVGSIENQNWEDNRYQGSCDAAHNWKHYVYIRNESTQEEDQDDHQSTIEVILSSLMEILVEDILSLIPVLALNQMENWHQNQYIDTHDGYHIE